MILSVYLFSDLEACQNENNFASCFIPLASDTSFPLVMVPACGKCDRKQIAVPYRSCLGVGIVQICVPLHLLVFGKQIAVYDQKIAVHKWVFQTSLFLPTQPQISTWGARDNKGPEQEDTVTENSIGETECSTGILKMGRVNRWEGGRWKDDFWNGFPKDLTSLAAALERGWLWCRQAQGSPAGCLDLPAASYVSKEATSAWHLRKYFIKIKSVPAWRSFWKLSKQQQGVQILLSLLWDAEVKVWSNISSLFSFLLEKVSSGWSTIDDFSSKQLK